MTQVNLLALWGTSVTVEIGDIDEDEALHNGDEFNWEQFDETLVAYLDSLSEEELRELYREPEAISIEDPIFDELDDVDVVMADGGLPEYLQRVVEEAEEYHNRSDLPPSTVAYEVAHEKDSLVSDAHGDRPNLEVLQDLRDVGCLCTDELDTYCRGAITYDRDDATIEAIVRRSLEMLLYKSLAKDEVVA